MLKACMLKAGKDLKRRGPTAFAQKIYDRVSIRVQQGMSLEAFEDLMARKGKAGYQATGDRATFQGSTIAHWQMPSIEPPSNQG